MKLYSASYHFIKPTLFIRISAMFTKSHFYFAEAELTRMAMLKPNNLSNGSFVL